MATTENGSASSLEQWRQTGRLHVTLNHGARIVMRTLTLHELAASGKLSDRLLRHALAETSLVGGSTGLMADKLRDGSPEAISEAREMAEDLNALMREIVVQAVVEPELSIEDLDGLPEEDLELIADLATRQRQYDAAGRRVGVEPLDTFATFRVQHGCAEDCDGCKKAQLELSAVHG